MLPRQVIKYIQLIKTGFKKEQIEKMFASLRLFPTPYKGIYYVPSTEEKNGWFIDNPLSIMFRASATFLKTNDIYYSCSTAEEFWGIKWQPTNIIHIVNTKKSGVVDLKKRIERSLNKQTFRAKKIAHLLSFYGNKIVFHKIKSIDDALIKTTPVAAFAAKSQIKKDRKRFHKIIRSQSSAPENR